MPDHRTDAAVRTLLAAATHGTTSRLRAEQPDDGVALLTLDHPNTLNALDTTTLVHLVDELARIRHDATVRTVVLSGANDAFCAGADLNLLGQLLDFSVPETEAVLAYVMQVSDLIHDLPQPTIAAVRGPAAGAGVALALACDLRFGSPDARFVGAFAKLGLLPDMGETWLLPRLVGQGRALEFLLSGTDVDGEAGRQLGLLTDVRPDPLAAALDLASRFARLPAHVVVATKRLLRTAAQGTLSEAIAREAAEQAAALHGPSFGELIGSWPAVVDAG